MGRRGRHAFLDRWHRRTLELPAGDTLMWELMANPERAPHAECFRRTSPDGTSRGVHFTAAVKLLRGAGHPDAELVPVDSYTRSGVFH
jgi:hypothetical protein